MELTARMGAAAGEWEEGGSAPRKGGVPSWVWWGCGGGCLAVTVLGAVLAIFVGAMIRDALDPEKAWAGVGELLPHDQRPEGWHVLGTTRIGRGLYVLRPPDDEALVVVQRARDREELAVLLDPASARNGGVWFLDALVAPEPGTLLLQGRETRCLRFREGFVRGERRGSAGAGLRVDVTGQGVPTLLHIVFPDEEETVSDERVAELLAPFDVWRGR